MDLVGRILGQVVGAAITGLGVKDVGQDISICVPCCNAGTAFDENNRGMVEGDDADDAVAEVEGGEVNILDELVEVEPLRRASVVDREMI